MNDIKFYRTRYDRLCLTLLCVSITLLLLNIGIFSRLAFQRLPEYYATSMNGTLDRLIPLDTLKHKI